MKHIQANVKASNFITTPLRIKTRARNLKSGFAYTEPLFELGISPQRWDAFSADVAAACKTTREDKQAQIGTIIGFTCLGLVGVGIVCGERVKERRKVTRVKECREVGGTLSLVLEKWNETYFCDFGIEVSIEIHEAALRRQARKNGEEPPEFVHGKSSKLTWGKDRWDKRRELMKFMVVISPIDEEGKASTWTKIGDDGDLIGLSDEPLLKGLEAEDPFADPPSTKL